MAGSQILMLEIIGWVYKESYSRLIYGLGDYVLLPGLVGLLHFFYIYRGFVNQPKSEPRLSKNNKNY